MKGTSFRSVLLALETLRGANAVERCLASMSDEQAAAFRYGTLLASGLYPIEWYGELLRAARVATGEGDRLLFELGRESVRHDMTGVYRAVFKLLSPQAVFVLASRLFSNYYDTGQFRIVESRACYALAKWSGCTGFNRDLWSEIFGGCSMFLELAGAKHIRTRTLEGGGDEDFATMSAHWT